MPCVDLVCTFTDTSVDPDGQIVARAWTIGSSGTSTDAAPTFTFAAPGTYQVSLTVADSDGATATATAAVQVRAVVHVSLVDAVITSGKNGKNTAHGAVSAIVEAHGADERSIAGATLNVTWNGTRTLSCNTGTDGPVHVQYRDVERQADLGHADGAGCLCTIERVSTASES